VILGLIHRKRERKTIEKRSSSVCFAGGCVWDLICFEEVGYDTMKVGFVSLNLFTYDIEPYVVILIMMSDCFDIYIDYDIKNVHVHG